MKKVVVASTNPVKLAVAMEAFRLVFPGEQFTFTTRKTPSHVPDQPFGDEARVGALNRMIEVTQYFPDADYWISQEGGLIDDGGAVLSNRAWIIVADREGNMGASSTASFEIPQKVAELIRGGLPLGDAWDKHYGTVGSKTGGGAMLQVTRGLIDRKAFYLQAAIIALCQVVNHHLYE